MTPTRRGWVYLAGLDSDSDVLIDQIRAIGNRRLIKPLGGVPGAALQAVLNNLALILDVAPGV